MRFNPVILVYLIILFVIYKIMRGVGLVSASQEDQAINEAQALSKGIDALNETDQCSNRLSYTQSQYDTLARKIYNAVKGLGTNEDEIYRVFNALNNECDLVALMIAYKILYKESLTDALYGDLNDRELAILNSILAEKRINFRF